MTDSSRKKKINIAGIVFTIIVTLGFTWAIYQLLVLPGEKVILSGQEMRRNEVAAYRNLKMIAAAQEHYFQKDWDGDGKKNYAVFYVHLWRSVTPQGEPIRVKLIPKKLAFAMDISSPLEGYYFVDLRRRRIDLRNRKEFDYKKDWGVAALPGIFRSTGVLTFIVDQSRDIFVTARMHSEPEYPGDPVKSGWTKIASVKELKEFQETVNYPVK